MPASRTQFADLIAKARRILKEPDPDTSFWSQDLLKDLFNMCLREREMQLMQANEGYGVEIVVADLVADQAEYDLPEDCARVRRVLRAADGVEYPLIREENWGQAADTTSSNCVPAYRLVGNLIVLNPPPGSNEADGLKVEYEKHGAALSSDADTIPDDWPLVAEDLLVVDTCIRAYDVEGAIGPSDAAYLSLQRWQVDLSKRFDDFIQMRSAGAKTYRRPFSQGS